MSLSSRNSVARAETLEPKVANTWGIDMGQAYATVIYVHVCKIAYLNSP